MRRPMAVLVRFACALACIQWGALLVAAGPAPPQEPVGSRGDASLRSSLSAVAERVVLPGRCRECHAAEFDAWEATAHATGFDSLHRGARAKEIAGRLGLPLIRRGIGDKTPACLSCHYTPVERRGRLRAGAGVSCESCHGPARDWVALHGSYGVPEADFQKAARLETAAHRAKRVADSTAAGMRRSSHLVELAATCFGCHTVANEEVVNRGGHSTGGDFELVAWSERIRHNFLDSYRTGDGRTNAERPRAWKRVLYVVGRALAVEHALRGVAAATEDDYYFAAMRDGAEAAIDELLAIDERVEILEVRKVLATARAIDLTLGNPALVEAADAVRTATKAFAAGADNDALAPLDPLWDPDLEESPPPAPRRLTHAAPAGSLVVGDTAPPSSIGAVGFPDPAAGDGRIAAEAGSGTVPQAGTGTTEPPPPGRATPRIAAETVSGTATEAEAGSAQSPPPGRAPPPERGAPSPVPRVIPTRPPWRNLPTHDFVGVPCGGCHRAQEQWWRGHRHSRAAARLRNGTPQAIAIARAFGISADDMARGTQICAWCHGTVTSRPSRRVRVGVGCQRCHGPGADYRDPHQTASYAQSVALGLTDLRDPAVQAATCTGCHYITDPGLIEAGHPSGADFDIVSRRASIVHWGEAFGRQTASVNPAELTAAHARVVAARGPVPARTAAVRPQPPGMYGAGPPAGKAEAAGSGADASDSVARFGPQRLEPSSPRDGTAAPPPRDDGGAALAAAVDALRRHLDALSSALGLAREP